MNRVVHFSISAFDGASKIAKPPTTSLASVNGPSVTDTLPSESRTRAPAEVGCSPIPSTRTQPALPASCTSWSMASRSALGGIPAIPSIDLTNEINRIVVSPLQSLIRFSSAPLVRAADAHLAKSVDRFALAEIFELEQLPDLDLAVFSIDGRIGKPPRPFERLLARRHLDH